MRRDVTVRRGALSDYEALGVVFDEAEEYHRTALPQIFREPDDRFPSRTLFDSWVRADDAEVFVAAHVGELVGFTAVQHSQTLEADALRSRKLAVVGLLAVRSSARRLGAGRAMMEATKEWAAERGLDAVSLTVWEFNASAIEFYEAIGFRTLSRTMEHPV